MPKKLEQIKNAIHSQLPTTANVNILNRGIAYNLDPKLTGDARFFKILEGAVRALAPDTTFSSFDHYNVGSNGIIFKQVTPDEGDALIFQGQQYIVTKVDDDIAYVEPGLRVAVQEDDIFRRTATPIEMIAQRTPQILDVQSKHAIVEGDTLQFGQLLLTVGQSVPVATEVDRYDCTIVEPITDIISEVKGYMILNPSYVSELIPIQGTTGPFDLAFPISTQFYEDFTLSLKVELVSLSGVISNTYSFETSNNVSPRIPIYDIPISTSSIVCMNRLVGKMDYNGSRVGLSNGCMLEWVDDFPEDQVDSWQLSIDSEMEGNLVVRLDPNPAQVFPIIVGAQSVTVQGFNSQPEKTKRFTIGFTSSEIGNITGDPKVAYPSTGVGKNDPYNAVDTVVGEWKFQENDIVNGIEIATAPKLQSWTILGNNLQINNFDFNLKDRKTELLSIVLPNSIIKFAQTTNNSKIAEYKIGGTPPVDNTTYTSYIGVPIDIDQEHFPSTNQNTNIELFNIPNFTLIEIACDSDDKISLQVGEKISFGDGNIYTVAVTLNIDPGNTGLLTIEGGLLAPLHGEEIITRLTSEEDKYCWIGEFIPSKVSTYIRYTMMFKSVNLYKNFHILFGCPRIEPSLLDIDICYNTLRLDSGYLIAKRQKEFFVPDIL